MTIKGAGLYDEILAADQSYTILTPGGRVVGNAFLTPEAFHGIGVEDLLFKPSNNTHDTPEPLVLTPFNATYRAAGLHDNAPRRFGEKAAGPIEHPESKAEEMSSQDRYIDARLAGIESKLDARMEAMQRFQETAEARMERAEDRMERAVERVESGSRATRWTVVGTGIAIIGLVATILYGTLTAFQQTIDEQGEAMRQAVSEQSAWLRQGVERIESKVDATRSNTASE